MWNDLPAGWQHHSPVRTTPQLGDVVVFDANYYQFTIAYRTGWTGHVSLVYTADNSDCRYMDYNSLSNIQSGQTCMAQLRDFSCVIRPDWPQNNERICDLGSDFHARIGHCGGWLQTTGTPIQDGDGQGMDVRVTLKSDVTEPRQIWHFLKQNDDSYEIVNMASGFCLDVQTGTVKNKQNVWTWSIDHGKSPERFFVLGTPG